MPPSFSPSPASSPAALGLARWFTAARQGGLLSALSAEDWQALCALLSFGTREGRCPFTLDQLAFALGTSREDALRRLGSLAFASWQGQSLLLLEQDASGEVVGAHLSHPDLFRPLDAPDGAGRSAPEAQDSAPAGVPGQGGAGDAAGSPSPDLELEGRLAAVGLYPDQIDRLMGQYPPEQIRRQLEWLPARRARTPAALLIRAVEGDWGPPGNGSNGNPAGEGK